jgi:hypothetical protein
LGTAKIRLIRYKQEVVENNFHCFTGIARMFRDFGGITGLPSSQVSDRTPVSDKPEKNRISGKTG